MSKYTRSAKGQECAVRIPGVCNHDAETTVFAHLNGAGIGMKHYDIHGCYACSDCHAFLDRDYVNYNWNKASRDLEHYRATIETQRRMIKEGILIL